MSKKYPENYEKFLGFKTDNSFNLSDKPFVLAPDENEGK